MDLYVLDGLLRRIAVVDGYESLIWTERFSSSGDFELKLGSSLENRRLFTEGTQLSVPGSTRVMTVETVQDSVDNDGKTILDIKGPSIENVLADRIAWIYQRDTTNYPEWVLTGTPASVCRQFFDIICRNATINSHDAIPNLVAGSLYPASTLPESTDVINVQQTPGYLYDAIKALCDANELGFRLVRSPVTNKLQFDIYAGSDRTSRQTTLSAVIFSSSMDDLQNTSELKTIQGSKNIAYVYSPAGFEIVYAPGVAADVEGFDRRIMFVDGSSVALDNPDISGALYQLGYDALVANAGSALFDGEINQYGNFVYERDYFLGDLVEIRNKDGIRQYKRVTEHIYVSDQSGVKSYPTLSADLFAGTGTWLELDGDARAWADLGSDPVTWTSFDGTPPSVPPVFVPQGIFDDFNRPDGPLTAPWYTPDEWEGPSYIVNHKVVHVDGSATGVVAMMDLRYNNFQMDFDFDPTGGFYIFFQGPPGLHRTTEASWYAFNFSRASLTSFGSASLDHYASDTSYTVVDYPANGFFGAVLPVNHFTMKVVNGEFYVTINGIMWSSKYNPIANLNTIAIQSLVPWQGGWYNFAVKEVLS